MSGKLVRNNIPALIENNGRGETPTYHQENDNLLDFRCFQKLLEEGHEIFNAESIEEKKEEFADALQLLKDWSCFSGFTWPEVEAMCDQKFNEKGSFSQGIILDSVQKGP